MPDEPANPLPVFFARRLCKTYGVGDIEVRALRDVDLDIYEGEFVVLLGPSGSGTSTLLNILGGFDAPTSGEARWREHNLMGASEAELTRYRREHVGFVFQFYNLIPSLTAFENVAGDGNIVLNYHGRGAQLFVGALDGGENNLAGFIVESTGRLVTKWHVWRLDDGACDCNPLLLATGQLGRSQAASSPPTRALGAGRVDVRLSRRPASPCLSRPCPRSIHCGLLREFFTPTRASPRSL